MEEQEKQEEQDTRDEELQNQEFWQDFNEWYVMNQADNFNYM